eukprot:5032458-Pyramimonas_sp.AAC.1
MDTYDRVSIGEVDRSASRANGMAAIKWPDPQGGPGGAKREPGAAERSGDYGGGDAPAGCALARGGGAGHQREAALARLRCPPRAVLLR